MIHLERQHKIEGGTCCLLPASEHVRALFLGFKVVTHPNVCVHICHLYGRVRRPYRCLVNRVAICLPIVSQSGWPLVGWPFAMPSAWIDYRVEKPSASGPYGKSYIRTCRWPDTSGWTSLDMIFLEDIQSDNLVRASFALHSNLSQGGWEWIF